MHLSESSSTKFWVERVENIANVIGSGLKTMQFLLRDCEDAKRLALWTDEEIREGVTTDNRPLDCRSCRVAAVDGQRNYAGALGHFAAVEKNYGKHIKGDVPDNPVLVRG